MLGPSRHLPAKNIEFGACGRGDTGVSVAAEVLRLGLQEQSWMLRLFYDVFDRLLIFLGVFGVELFLVVVGSTLAFR